MTDSQRLSSLIAPPADSLLLFGAQVGHSPAREGEPHPHPLSAPARRPAPLAGKVATRKDRRKGAAAAETTGLRSDSRARRKARALACPGGVCRACGSDLSEPTPGPGLEKYETLDMVCSVCSRSHYDGKHRGSQHIEDPKRPSHRAARVAGTPEPRLNPYLWLKQRAAES